MSTPSHFYCEDCAEWTRVNAVDELFCSICGADYACGECGSDINRDGSCTNGDCKEAES